MTKAWQQELWRILVLTLSLLIVGILTGYSLFFLLIACIIYLGWHLYHLYILDSRIRSKRKIEVGYTPGIWGEVFYNFHRLQQRNRKRKNKLTNLLKRFRRSTAAMPDATIVLGPKYEIEWFNKAAKELLGFKLPHDKGKNIANIIRYPAFTQYLNKDKENDSLKMPSPAKPEIMLRVSIVPYAGNRHLMLARDITQIYRLEQIRRDFVANISHELRTPLTVIAGFIETMHDEQDECSQQWERPLMLMAQQTARMSNIVDDLLLLSRLESEPPPSMEALETIDMQKMLMSICEEAHLLSGEQHHDITLEADENLTIHGNSKELRSAFSNLVFNAVRYTPAEGKIAVAWYKDDKGLHFSVTDTGEGIAPEHIPRLTERFYRVDVGRSRSKGGTGLGLAIVKHVLNRYGGQLRIESTVGKGSTFYCDFSNTLL